MICRLLNIASEQEWLDSSQWLNDRAATDPAVEETVREIINNVRVNGDDAIVEYTRKFDCPDFKPPLRVSEEEMELMAAQVSVDSREAILMAASNIRAFHEAQKEKSWFMDRPDGTILGQRVTPVDAVGLYVPGGLGGDTPLVSSLLMNAIPAQVAQCPRIAVITPPRRDGRINPHLLAAAYLLGIDEVYKAGGAWGVAALALGTGSIEKVDLIAGPGNIYVTTAKRLLHGSVGIDMIAGPSEVLVLADRSANPSWIAADMLSQAEHDRLASAICITTDMHIAEALAQELEKQLASLPRAQIAEASLRDWGCIVITPNLRVALAIANRIAPEHMEICTKDPWAIMPHVRNAGAVFLGENSPEPVGDYMAGPNHVLPTLGTARFASSLSVQTFCKKTNIISASRTFLRQYSTAVATLARLEGLEAHARSVEARQMTPHTLNRF